MTSTTTTLTDSISSLSSSSPSRAPSISRIYKQASQLFLTRQLAEAWEVLTPLVNPGTSSHASQSDGGYSLDSGSNGDDTNGYHNTNGSNAFHNDPTHPEPRSPIATASKSARVKVWGLWLALVNELLKLGPEDGAAVMAELRSGRGNKSGAKRWKEIANKVQEGAVWEDVVKVGYEGNEAAVDGEVVANLATLLLSHSPSQTKTQSRLEIYLSSTTSGPSPSELASKLGDPTSAPTSHHRTQNSHGTSTPADLNTRLKLLEIYTLHVLPRNEEWDYAREFISLSEILDDDRREAFLAALGGLREESELQSKREGELLRRRQQEEEEVGRRKEEYQKRRTEEEANRKQAAEMGLNQNRGAMKRDREDTSAGANGSAKPTPPTASGPKRQPPANDKKKPTPSAAPAKRPRGNGPPDNFLHRASHTLAAVQRAVLQMGSSIISNPMMILRFLLFLMAMVVALGRRDVRERVGRAWEKVRGTIGMGVKTTYL